MSKMKERVIPEKISVKCHGCGVELNRVVIQPRMVCFRCKRERMRLYAENKRKAEK